MNDRNFVIVTESTIDMPKSWVEENDVYVMQMAYTIDGVTYTGIDDDVLDPKEFFNKLRNGKLSTTSQITPIMASEAMEPLLKEGKDILYIGFSSALSGTFSNVSVTVEELLEKYPDRKIELVDSLGACMGEGLFVHYAIKMRDEGKTLEEAKEWFDDMVQHFCFYVTADDLHHLQRGGRVSKSAAMFGSMLGVKPMIYVNDKGQLIPIDKVRGRKQAISKLADYMDEKTKNYPVKNEVVYICHADCEDEALSLKSMIEERFGITNIMLNMMGPVIGSHAGAGTIALFFLGESR